jgi:hypothetical protein
MNPAALPRRRRELGRPYLIDAHHTPARNAEQMRPPRQLAVGPELQHAGDSHTPRLGGDRR